MRKQFDKYEKDGILTLDELLKYNRIRAVDKEIVLIIRELYKRNSALTNEVLENLYTNTFEKTMNFVSQSTGREIRGIVRDFNVEKTINENMAGFNWADRYDRHRNEAIYKVRETVRSGLSEGQSYGTMSQNLKKTLQGDVEQPARIIRTEGKRVLAQAQKDSLDHASSQGVKMIKIWRTSKDERVRGNNPKDLADHVSMEGQTVDYEDNFILPDGTETFAPGLSGVAKHDINERCYMVIDFK